MAGGNGKGFEILLDPDRRILRVRVWGFWDGSFMRKYESAFTEKAEELNQYGKGWSALVDVSALCSRSEEIQEGLCQQLIAAAQLGMKKLACIGQGNAPPLQFNRLFLSQNIKKCLFAASEEEALQWLIEKPSWSSETLKVSPKHDDNSESSWQLKTFKVSEDHEG